MRLDKRRNVEIQAFSKYFNELVRIDMILITKRDKNQIMYKLNDILMLTAYGKRSNHMTVYTASFVTKRTWVTVATLYTIRTHGKRSNHLTVYTAFFVTKRTWVTVATLYTIRAHGKRSNTWFTLHISLWIEHESLTTFYTISAHGKCSNIWRFTLHLSLWIEHESL